MKRLFVALLAFSITLLSGCAVVDAVAENPQTAKATTFYATAKIINGDTDRANRAIEIAARASATVGESATATVAELDAFVREEINWSSLSPEDAVFLDLMLTEAATRLQERIGAGSLNPDQRVALRTFLSWIQEAARMYAEKGVTVYENADGSYRYAVLNRPGSGNAFLGAANYPARWNAI